MSRPRDDLVAIAIPCRTDEPALERVLHAAWQSWCDARRPGQPLELLVCLNGAEAPGPHAALRRFAEHAGVPLADVDAERPPRVAELESPLRLEVLRLGRAGKPAAWNVLRARTRAPVAIFMDADVSFARDAIRRLLTTLTTHPDAAIACVKTTCAPRPGIFEQIMAAPYRVDFPNISPQLYAARVAVLPRVMPEDLIEPERWLELVAGRGAVVRARGATVTVRLPGTLRDFFRQRVRIEMGKIQLAREYPGLEVRGRPQPGVGAVVASLRGTDAVRAAAYLALRTVAHGLAWWRFRRGRTAGVWLQAATTKRWDEA